MKLRNLCIILLSVLLMQNAAVCMADERIFSEPETEQYLNALRGIEIFSLYENEKIFFNDSEPVTRAEAAKAISGLLNCGGTGDSERASEAFVDVPDFHPGASDIDAVVSLGIMVGMNNGRFEPDQAIQLKAFAKAIVTALGWQWKAEQNGGYPLGYFSLAQQMGLLNGIDANGDETLNRAQLVRILYHSLDVPIYDIKAISRDKIDLTLDKEENVLSKYHNVYFDKAIVNSDKITSLKAGYQPKQEYILLGEQELETNGRTAVWNYFGQQIEYYYRQLDEQKQLLYFVPTLRNERITITKRNFENYQNGIVTYFLENGKTERICISETAAIIINGCRAEKNIENALNLKSGRMTLISNDGASEANVVIIDTPVHDRVEFVDSTQEIIYGKTAMYDVKAKKYFSLLDESGNTMEIGELLPNDILEIVSGGEGTVLKITVIRKVKTVRVAAIDAVLKGLETEDEEFFFFSDGCNITPGELEIGHSYSIYVNPFDEIVWIDERARTEGELGYLIKATEKRKGLTTEFSCSIVQANGEVANFMSGEELRINGKSYKKEEALAVLKTAKQTLGVASDGAVSQLIQYTVSDKVLKEIITAGTDSMNRDIILKCNSAGRELPYRHTGYLTGIFDSKYAISSDTVIFKVPLENQEILNKDYFSTCTYTNHSFADGGRYCVETYVSDKNAIVPAAAVWYSLSEGTEIDETASLFLVEKTLTAADTEGNPVKRLKGYYNKKQVIYDVLDDVSTDNISAGDIIVISLNAGDKIQALKKVYDYANGTVAEEFSSASLSARCAVRRMKIYNAPENSDFIELIPVDYAGEAPEAEDVVLVSIKAVRNGNDTGLASCVGTRKFYAGEPSYIVDYKHDAKNCTEAVVRFSSNYTGDVIFYDK